MLCLSDNDLILKLAEFDLLGDAVEVLGVTRKDVLILPRAKRVFPSKVGKTHTRDGVDRAMKFIAGLELVEQVDPQEHIILQRAKFIENGIEFKIDPGEATLFAATKLLDDVLVATGDKKCLRALHACADCAPIISWLEARVICLEQVILRLIDHKGYKWVQSRVGRGVGDKSMEQAFADGRADWPEVECRKWLDAYVADLKQKTGCLLVPA